MRARKLAVAFDETPPEEAAFSYADDGDDGPAPEPELAPLDRVCIGCGGDGGVRDGCEHREIARDVAPSRTIHDALLRVRRAAAEHRAAVRALRVLVLAEVARGRGDLETKPEAVPEPCPRCLIRAAEEANGPKPPRRRGRGGEGQQALPFKAS